MPNENQEQLSEDHLKEKFDVQTLQKMRQFSAEQQKILAEHNKERSKKAETQKLDDIEEYFRKDTENKKNVALKVGKEKVKQYTKKAAKKIAKNFIKKALKSLWTKILIPLIVPILIALGVILLIVMLVYLIHLLETEGVQKVVITKSIISAVINSLPGI